MRRPWHTIRIVPTESLKQQSHASKWSVRKLVNEISIDCMQRNPVAVAPTGDGQYVILDGISRWKAFGKLRVNDIMVQVVNLDDPGLKLSSWRHLISHLTTTELERMLGRKELEWKKSYSDSGGEELHAEKDTVLVTLSDRSNYSIALDRSDLIGFNRTLSQLITGYSANTQLVRLHGEPRNPGAHSLNRQGQALVVLPAYDMKEVNQILDAGELLPPHMLCYSFPRRFLGINVSLKILSADVPVSEKNVFIDELMRMRLSQSKATFYPNSVFLMND